MTHNKPIMLFISITRAYHNCFTHMFESQVTVNVEIFAQYIFSRISGRALDARKLDVNENYYHNRTNRINWSMSENLAVRMCLLMLDARKVSCAKICTFTVLPIICL